MLVLVKSAPDTPEGKRGALLAKEMGSDLVLIQNGVYFALQKERLEGFCGTAYALENDLRLRGLRDEAFDRSVRTVDYASLVDLMAEADKVIGVF
ncbi:MAG: sulfurtransferase complex subunit TusB [Nitrospirae bacterium]|nr:sulfurtransferase complex subunit TusB [Nitrospirota bacterium]